MSSQDIESVASIRAGAERHLDWHQRRIETLTGWLGRPRSVYAIVLVALGWGAFNVWAERSGWPSMDPPPFFWMQGAIGLCGLVMLTLVLVTENRRVQNAEAWAHLDLQINVLAERKIAKLVALVEELRRDLPMVANRVDAVAEAMQHPADPNEVLAALRSPEVGPPDSEEGRGNEQRPPANGGVNGA